MPLMKGELSMEIKEIEVVLMNIDNKDILEFKFEQPEHIDLNSEDQTHLREVFYLLMKDIIKEKTKRIKLNLTICKENPTTKLFEEIATEYIKQLNLEIEKIYEDVDKLREEYL